MTQPYLDQAGKRISKHRDKSLKIIKAEDQIEQRIEKSKESLGSLCSTIKGINICNMGVSEGEKERQRAQELFGRIMTDNFPNMKREMVIHVHEAQ